MTNETRKKLWRPCQPASGAWAQERGLAIATALIVWRRDPGTDARVALEAALR